MSVKQIIGSRSFFNYSEEDMENAIAAVRNGMSKKKAAICFNVPRTTLIRRLKGNFIENQRGDSLVLTEDEEAALEYWILSVAEKGFPIHKHLLLSAVKIILDKQYRPNSFEDNIPDDIWFNAFMNRHPNVSKKYAENLTSVQVSFDVENINKIFDEFKKYLTPERHKDDFSVPEFVFTEESMEDGDGNLKADTVKGDQSPSTTNKVNDVEDSVKALCVYNTKSNVSDKGDTREEREPQSSNFKNLSNIETSNKVNGELEYPKKSGIDVKNNSLNQADVNEDLSLDSQEVNKKQPGIVVITRKRKNKTKIDFLIESEKKSDEVSDGSVSESHSVEYKGFKKRILAQTEKLNDISNRDSTEIIEVNKKITSKTNSKKIKLNSEKDHSQQEYAQYLGLQPTVKFKCYRCSEKFQTMALLQGHQRICGSLPPKTNHQQAALSPVDPNLSTNFRITRKVYLCSACGTYYENWNLFLHMRDVHKRHICLFCLGMFSVADKLAEHLMSKHSIHESTIESSEEFLNLFKGSCFLMCCSCEKIFTERDDFYGHHCIDPAITALNVKCPLCGVKCGHFVTCPNNVPHCTPTTTVTSNLKMQTSQAGNISTSQSMPVTKYFVPIGKNVTDKWSKKSTSKSQSLQQTKDVASTSMDYDEDYDISDAASFCHVDIGGDATSSFDKSEVDKSDTGNQCLGDENSISNEDRQCKLQERERNSEEFKHVETPIVVSLEPHKIITDVEKEIVNESESKGSADSLTEDVIEKQNHTKLSHQENSTPTVTENNSVERSSDEEITNAIAPEIVKDPENVTLNTIESSEKTSEDNIVLPNSTVDNIKKVDRDATEESSDSQEENGAASANTTAFTKESSISPTNIKTNENLDVSNEDVSDAELDLENNSRHDSDFSDDISDEEQSVHEDNSKLDENGQKTASESEDSEKLSLVLSDKAKKNTSDEAIKYNKNHVENQDDDIDSNSSNGGNEDEDINDKSPDDIDCQKSTSDDSSSVESNHPKLNEDSKIRDDGIQVASDDIPAMALTLEDKLDAISVQAVIKECVRTSCTTCVYCSHAVKIAVNGKQLALHLLAEHRYTPIKNETTEDVVVKLKNSLPELENVFFNTDSYDSSDKSLNVPHDHTYDCFQCHFVTKNHKELYIHKKKMHQKTILLCVMCKSNFYSYSELLCHLCPGIYVSEDILFRCCYCDLDQIPSAFRLMVHLRKSHHTCDICLEVPGDQQKLSTHMWKHKLHHLCYKCGIAYRNKPDITKHLFWKHGTESVLCKRCLQKKWPHVYHFCIPPTVFICEECNANFSKAVALKVHKRLHAGDLPYSCDHCEQKFISKKLLRKHEESHKQEVSESNSTDRTKVENNDSNVSDKDETVNVLSVDDTTLQNVIKDPNNALVEEKSKTETHEPKSHKKRKKDKDKKSKHVVDVYDLPPLNLSSESDDSDGDDKTLTNKLQSVDELSNALDQVKSDKPDAIEDLRSGANTNDEDPVQPVPVVDGVWDNFHSYKAELEKREALDSSVGNTIHNIVMDLIPDTNTSNMDIYNISVIDSKTEVNNARDIVMADHDYCLQDLNKVEEQNVVEPVVESQDEKPAPREHSSSIDHDYCSSNTTENAGSNIANTINDTMSEQVEHQLPPQSTIIETLPSQKKKTKSSKKKFNKHNSSSSSDSSSDSDSSNCSCGTNCSCSSSSSNSSSSSSSDSESSNSESRQHAAAKKEKRKDKTKSKQEDSNITTAEMPVEEDQAVEDEPVVDLSVEPVEISIQESDLDTDETLTDEDFYDEHPQRHANQLLAQKRNQLMLLAAVAPVNNGNISPPQVVPQSPTSPNLPPVEEPPPAPSDSSPPHALPVKRKIKSKKRKKSQQQNLKASNTVTSSFYETQPSTSFPSKKSLNSQNNTNSTSHHPSVPNFLTDAAPGSGSETESTRLSKRKRVRNKFYGYSSDEEEDNKPAGKWRRVDPVPTPSPQTPVYNYSRSLSVQQPIPPTEVHYSPKQSDSSASEDEEILPLKKTVAVTSNSSSSSSDSDSEVKPVAGVPTEQAEKNDNLYCYCQCPYDEVSEMIACDGVACNIEWFHFECVGIMVPPKGKWYCPDCRKKKESV